MTASMSKPKLVLFDLDGTLIEFHYRYLMTEAERIILELNHPPIARGILEAGYRDFDFFRFVAEHDREEFIERFWKAFDWDNFPQAVPINGSEDVLSELNSIGVHSAIVTARIMGDNEIRLALEHTGLLRFISQIWTRPGEHVHWTDKRQTIQSACAFAGVAPEEAVMVGDIPPDIISARDVGVGTTIAVSSGGLSKSVLRAVRPNLLLQDVSELLEVIKSHWGQP